MKKEVRAWSSNPQTREWLKNEKVHQMFSDTLTQMKREPGWMPCLHCTMGKQTNPLSGFVSIIVNNTYWTLAHHFKFEKQYKRYLQVVDQYGEKSDVAQNSSDKLYKLFNRATAGKEKAAKALILKAQKEACKALESAVK